MYWNPFIFVGYGNDRYFFHTNPYISKSKLRNNSDIFRAWATCDYTSLFDVELEKILVNADLKITALCQTICLPSITSNVTNKKNELWKTASLTSFQKSQLQNDSIFFCVHASVLILLFLLCYLYLLSTFWKVIFMFHSFLVGQFPLFEFW